MLRTGGQLGFRWQSHPEDVSDELCLNRYQGPEHPTIKVIPKHSLGFDVGLLYNLEPDGKFKSHLEAAFFARSQWHKRLLAGVEARYSAIQPSETPEMASMMEGDSENGEEEGNDMATADGGSEPPTFNPFDEEGGGGVAELDAYIAFTPVPKISRLSVMAGLGFSTVPGDSSFTEVKTRTYYGLRIAVEGFNAGERGRRDHLENARGNVQLLFVEDDLFESVVLQEATTDEDGNVVTPAVTSDESDRYRLTGEIELPRVGNEWLRIVLRGHASIPRSGDGPSDLRLSALASIDPRQWFGGVGKRNDN
ncbi:MAG: hypothetical protein MPN21_02325 [Thermoanaerobaculia bacterium]|nr:hypothetical protein [Thermoanaerobaculia bacterium]